jgi:predicted CoA-binding protein
MSGSDPILAAVKTVLLVDWPSRDVPDTLIHAGYTVHYKGGPAADDFFVYQVDGGQVVDRRTGEPPSHADLVYAHRPLGELTEIARMAKQAGATVLWWQSGVNADGAKDPRGCWVAPDESDQARGIAEAAGLRYIDSEYIADAVRRLDLHH